MHTLGILRRARAFALVATAVVAAACSNDKFPSIAFASDAQLSQFVNALRDSSKQQGTWWRKCKSGCDSIAVSLAVVDSAHTVSYASLAGGPRAVALIDPVDTTGAGATDDAYEMTRGRHTYVLEVARMESPSGKDSLVWQMTGYNYTVSGGGVRHYVSTGSESKTGTYKFCEPQHAQPADSAGFYTCAAAHGPGSAARRRAGGLDLATLSIVAAVRRAGVLPPLWVSCAYGCCYAN